MALFLSEQVKRRMPQVEMDDSGGDVIPFTLVCTATAVTSTDIVKLGVIPAGFIPAVVQVGVNTGGPTIAGSIGYLNAADTAVATELATASATPTACLGAALDAGDGAERAFGLTGLTTTAGQAGKKLVVLVTLVATP